MLNMRPSAYAGSGGRIVGTCADHLKKIDNFVCNNVDPHDGDKEARKCKCLCSACKCKQKKVKESNMRRHRGTTHRIPCWRLACLCCGPHEQPDDAPDHDCQQPNRVIGANLLQSDYDVVHENEQDPHNNAHVPPAPNTKKTGAIRHWRHARYCFQFSPSSSKSTTGVVMLRRNTIGACHQNRQQ